MRLDLQKLNQFSIFPGQVCLFFCWTDFIFTDVLNYYLGWRITLIQHISICIGGGY